MLVCHCARVSDRDVLASVLSGARTVAQVCRDTEAGRTCGGCVPTLRRILCQHACATAQPAAEVAGATR